MKKLDMTHGNEGKILIQLSLPIIASNFIQTAFGMINMVWVGKLGSGAVSAIGTASFFINLATAISMLIVIGTGVKIAQALGSGKEKIAESYLKNSLILSVVISILFCIIVFLFSNNMINFFGMNDVRIEEMAVDYLRYSLLGVPTLFLTSTLTAILTSYGNTKATFRSNSIGLIMNIILDPILIFGVGLIPAYGVVGAAIATSIARLVTVFLMAHYGRNYIFTSFKEKINLKRMKEICVMGIPVVLQRVIFIFISIYMAKIIVRFGTEAIAVQKIGVQIESISYMTIGGVQGAISAFIAQNFGAKKNGRIINGFNKALILVCVFGFIISLIFIIFPRQLFSIFISEPDVIELGIGYMQTLGISQIFMCMELLSVGAFNGIGKTYVPPLVSIILTTARIPIAILLSTYMGLNGVWMSISITSIVKGMFLTGWFKQILKKFS